MNKWSELTMKQKAAVIKFGIDNGVSDINDIRNAYENYANDDRLYGDITYDGLGYYLNSNERPVGQEAHYTDTYKTPSHPTFSTGSKYNSRTFPAGEWRERGNNWTYEPTDFVLNEQGGWNKFLDRFMQQEGSNAYNGSYPVYKDGVMLPEVTVTANKKRNGGNLKSTGGPIYPFSFNGYIPEVRYDKGGDLNHLYWPGGKLFGKIKNTLSNIGNSIVSLFNSETSDSPNTNTNDNTTITNEEVVDKYINEVMWTMENPKNAGYNSKDGKYYVYTDKDANGNIHYNLGPGINKNSDVGNKLDYSNNKGYTKEELNDAIRPDLLLKMDQIMESLHNDDIKGTVYGNAADTLSIGPRLVFLDIAHNVRPHGNLRKNMPVKWPSLTQAFMTGDIINAKKHTNSQNERRQLMRNDLLYVDRNKPINLKNR